MPHPAPYARLFAEAEAWPLASAPAFRLGTTRLARPAIGVLDSPTTRLAVGLEEHLRLRAGGMSLDALRQLRDSAWFHEEELAVDLAAYTARIAERFLRLSGDHATLHADGNLPHRVASWRWLSLCVPPDLLLAALAANRSAEPPAQGVSLSSPQLRQLLDKGVAETHLHASAAASFAHLWTGLMTAIAGASPTAGELDRGGPPPFGGGAGFLARLVQAAMTRVLLASFLWRREVLGGSLRFNAFLDEPLAAIAERLSWPRGSHDAATVARQTVAALGNSAPSPPTAELRLLLGGLQGPAPRAVARTLAELVGRDPLAAWLAGAPGLAVPETRFATRALRYLLDEGRPDAAFAAIFWQYQRVRGLTYRHLVEEPGTAGLDWFQRHFQRINGLRGALEPVTFETALHLERAELRLDSLEVRARPPERWHEVRDLARALATQVAGVEPPAGIQRPEVGLVMHFAKQRERAGTSGPRLEADPSQLAHGCRYGAWAHEQMNRARAIAAALRQHPELLLVLRGIDVASVELAIPAWPVLLSFGIAREAAAEAAAVAGRRWPTRGLAPLRASYHVGEDFRRLIEGLRRIHELMEFGLVEAGDRLGHAVALGESAKHWARGAHVVAQPAEERLDDLLWEMDRYRHADLPFDGGRAELVRAECLRLGGIVYGDGDHSVDQLVRARRRRHDPRLLARFGYPFTKTTAPADPVERLVYRHLTDVGVFRRGQRPIEVKMDDSELSMLRAAGRFVRAEAARFELTVESNPSSNLLIGDFVDVADHPAFRLKPLRGGASKGGPPVLLSINDDDPLTFATRLADELAYVYFALLRSGVPATDAATWVDSAREEGLRSRFTLAGSRDETWLSGL